MLGHAYARRLESWHDEGREAQHAPQGAHHVCAPGQIDAQPPSSGQVRERRGVPKHAGGCGGYQRAKNRGEAGDGQPLQHEDGQYLRGRCPPASEQGDLGPPLLHDKRRERRHVVQDDDRDQHQHHEHRQLGKEESPLVCPQHLVQPGDLRVAGQHGAERAVHPHQGDQRRNRVAGVYPARVHDEQPRVSAVELPERRPQDLQIRLLLDVERQRPEAGPRRRLEHTRLQLPDVRIRVVPYEDPADRHRHVRGRVVPERHGAHFVAYRQPEQPGRLGRHRRLDLQRPARRVPGAGARSPSRRVRDALIESWHEREVGPSVVLPRRRFAPWEGQEKRLGLSSVQLVAQEPVDSLLDLGSGHAADPLVLVGRSGAASALYQDVEVLLGVLGQGPL